MAPNDRIKAAFGENLSGLYVSPARRGALLADITGGKKVKRKLTVGLVCVMVLALVAVTALAVTAYQAWMDRVAELSREGVFTTWALEDKVEFVEAMREAGLGMEEADYAALANPDLDEAARHHAAHRIIDDRYGELMREHAAAWIEPPETVWGMAPDEVVIFREAYFAEHPDAAEQEYRDALAYWARDMGRHYEASIAATGEEQPKVDEAFAAALMELTMLDYFSLPSSDADKLAIRTEYAEAHQAWVCEASVPKTVADFPKGLDKTSPSVLDLGDAWGMRMVVDRDGQPWRSRTLEEYLAEAAAEPIWNLTGAECEKIAQQGVMDTFGLSLEEVDRYFISTGDLHQDEHRYALMTVIFKEHSDAIKDDWAYAAMVNGGTGELVDCVDKEGLWDRLPAYAEAYPTLTNEERIAYERWLLHGPYNPYGGYQNWTTAQKAEWNAWMGQYIPID